MSPRRRGSSLVLSVHRLNLGMNMSLEKWSQMSSIVGMVVSILMMGVSIFGLLLIFSQLDQVTEHKKWENYNAMNLRYYKWYSQMPDGMDKDSCVPFKERTMEVKNWTKTYFDLYAEEHWLYIKGLIPDEMWTKMIDKGVNVNLVSFPVLVRGYEYWKNKKSFTHPEGFINLVDEKLIELGIMDKSCD